MSRLMSRGATLTVSRISNFGILFFSPLLLVRILDVEGYGQYQEFMIYAMFLIMVCEFGLSSSLTYFLPKYPDRERLFLVQTTFLVFLLSSLCLLGVIAAQPLFAVFASFDFVLPLAAYVFCFVNLNWLEHYWVAKRRVDLVLYYSVARLLVRVGVLLAVAYATRDVQAIIWSIVGVEAARMLLVAFFAAWAGWFSGSFGVGSTKEQLLFASPIGAATLAQYAARNAGKIFVGAAMGPAALAYYAVASYLLPLVRVVGSSISEVVFPELVRAHQNPSAALELWKRTNIVFCVLFFPSFVFLWHYSELIVVTLFTSDYLAAVPVFQIYLLWLLRRCFNLDVLLRTRGKTGCVLIGTVGSLAISLVLMVSLYARFGLIGPAVAFILSEVVLELYYGNRVRREFNLSVAEMIDWSRMGRVAAGCFVAYPALLAAGYLPGHDLGRAAAAALIFFPCAWFISYRMGVEDIGRVVAFATASVRKRMRSFARSAA
jgi:O-antigen/teichoic acid export membrane protein